MCIALITLAKFMVNTNKLKLVLVSSEGAIMPYLEQLSAANRSLVSIVKRTHASKRNLH